MIDVSPIPTYCPKCGRHSEHRYNYVPRGVVYRGYDDAMYVGPCMVRTCLICDYSYKEATADGEGNSPEAGHDRAQAACVT